MELDTVNSVSNFKAQTNAGSYTKAETGTSKEHESVGGSAKRPVAANSNVASVYLNTKNVTGKSRDNKNTTDVHQTGVEREDIEYKADRNTNEVLDKAIAEINEKLFGANNECQYNVHKQTGLIQVKVLNSKTKEVIREIPPVSRLDALAKMWELAGILVDTKG